MRTFREHIEDAFFVITSENIAKIKQGRLYGYSICNGKLIKDCYLTEDINITSESLGLFVAIKKCLVDIVLYRIAQVLSNCICLRKIITGQSAIRFGVL